MSSRPGAAGADAAFGPRAGHCGILLSRFGVLALALAVLPGTAGGADRYDRAVEDFRRTLSALVAADTTNPPGNEARAVEIVARRLDAAGIEYEVSEFAPGRRNLVARLAGSGPEKPLMLLAHTDVVGTSGQDWSTDPHVVTEKDGFLVGRGVSDDLGMAGMALEVMVLLRESKTPLRRDVILALTGDEESGGAGIRHLLENDPTDAGIALNEGGTPVLGDDGSVRFISLQVAEKTYRDFEISASGPTGHSSVPMPGNPIDRLSRALARLAENRPPVRLLPVTRAYFRARAALEPPPVAAAMRAAADAEGAPPAEAVEVLEADPVSRALLRTTCVATMLEGGTRVNALPATATANVNCRILPDETVDEVQARLAAWIDDPEVTIRPLEDFASGPPSPTDGEVPDAVRRVVEAMWPGTPIIPTMSLGATDSRFLRRAGVAAYGISPIGNREADARRAHGIDERIPITSLRSGIELLHRLVLDLAATGS